MHMLANICILFFTGIILLFPVYFWSYVFLSQYDSGVSRKQFLMWILSGWAITLVFTYANTLGLLWRYLDMIFWSLSTLNIIGIFVWLLLLIWLFILCIGAISLPAQRKISSFSRVYFISVLYYIVLTMWAMLLIYTWWIFLSRQIGLVTLPYLSYSFISFGAILWYYIIVSLIEEAMKYFTTSWSYNLQYSPRFIDFLILWSSVALGFAFAENIIYTYAYIQQYWPGIWLLSLVFFRSVFTIILHVIGVLFMTAGFWFILFSQSHILRRLKAFLVCGAFSLLSHTLFDVSLTYNYIGFIFLYIVIIYFTLTYLTTHQEW